MSESCCDIIYYGINDVIIAWKEGLITEAEAKEYLKRVFGK